jgi:hypothetical protein
MRVRFASHALGGAVVLLTVVLSLPAAAQAPARKNAPSPPAAAAVPAAPAPAAVEPGGDAKGIPGNPAAVAALSVTGFRSAKFGMAEAEVRAAIEKDFVVKPDQIRSEENLAEQTHVLGVRVPDLLAGGGTAEVSYVFGYKTKKLIEVTSLWSKATDDKITPERLFSNGNILRAHFSSEGYQPDSIVTNGVMNNGIVMFRGSDAEGHTTVLVLQGTTSEGADKQRVLTPTALLLFYLADAKNPDVFKLPPGQF